MSKRLAMIAISRALGTIIQIGEVIKKINNFDLQLQYREKQLEIYDRIMELDHQFNNTENTKRLREIRRKVEKNQSDLDRLLLLVKKEAGE